MAAEDSNSIPGKGILEFTIRLILPSTPRQSRFQPATSHLYTAHPSPPTTSSPKTPHHSPHFPSPLLAPHSHHIPTPSPLHPKFSSPTSPPHSQIPSRILRDHSTQCCGGIHKGRTGKVSIRIRTMDKYVRRRCLLAGWSWLAWVLRLGVGISKGGATVISILLPHLLGHGSCHRNSEKERGFGLETVVFVLG